jgi:hypothetical protein
LFLCDIICDAAIERLAAFLGYIGLIAAPRGFLVRVGLFV